MQGKTMELMCTCGPTVNTPEMIAALIKEGITTFRINFSHGARPDHMQFAETVRAGMKLAGKQAKLMGDIQGPKFRIGMFEGSEIQLAVGSKFVLDSDNATIGSQDRVFLPHPEMAEVVEVGDEIILNDGLVVVECTEKIFDSATSFKITTKCVQAGPVSNKKGISIPCRLIKTPFPTEKDKVCIETANMLNLEFLMLSFVQCPQDVLSVRALAPHAHLMSKIETPVGVHNVEAIAEVSDSLLIARGDLGVEARLSRVPMIQKHMCKLFAGKKTIYCATQFLESMVNNKEPSFSEVNDIFNAIQDGVDGILLTGETANGKWPVEAVRWLKNVVDQALAFKNQ
ncbi:Pyruvate_kinase [Hexamita inflata]|uniref:Pyruvate kinase n=1 Tax=Hexamita inflata TaxID=28002 RepID=A0AA86NMK8_9EUKA|nr:Pyruvate kinase [Hexamita inflata]CAI9921753.1 Pyruvate kinase [Hexamita inflata]CAI9975051.1 Pyruvate kinase [Hexamita inflata]CAI9975053.1 Pyruvate kinase [Hexamita inflata]